MWHLIVNKMPQTETVGGGDGSPGVRSTRPLIKVLIELAMPLLLHLLATAVDQLLSLQATTTNQLLDWSATTINKFTIRIIHTDLLGVLE